MFTLQGAKVLGQEGLEGRDITVVDGIFGDGREQRAVPLEGYVILPGIVDLHGDGFERHLAPRRGAIKDLSRGLLAAETEFAASGITTAVLAQFYSWEGGMRGPAFAAEMLDALDRTRALVATDLVAQLRFETSLLDQYESFFELVTRHNVPFVVFNDHLPHDALAAGKRPPRLTGQALKSGRSPEAHLEMLQALHNNGPEVALALPELAARLRALGVLIGAHDLQAPADHADMAAMGARLAEFPETREAAEAARSAGHPVVMGAPNVLRGGSHKKNVSAADLVKAGLCDALASDYHYPALAQAALGFVAEMGWTEAWALVSKKPAQILGFKDRGEIATGQRADFIVMNAATQRIEATFVAGRPSFMTGDAALAFMQHP